MERVEFISRFSSREAIVERCYVSRFTPSNPLKASIDMDYIDPVYVVGVYKRKEKYYLQLIFNSYSHFIDKCFENNSLPNCGTMQLSEQDANKHIYNLLTFGKEIYDIKLKNFDIVLNALTSIIPCKVDFIPLFDQKGLFNKEYNCIVIANNNSHFSIISSLLHEYVHYLTQNINPANESPKNLEKYYSDFWEKLCEDVAFIVIRHYFSEHIEKNYKKFLKTIKDSKNNELMNLNESDFSEEQIKIINYLIPRCFCNNKITELFSKQISNDIIAEIDKKLKTNTKERIDFYQSGLAVLSDDDNQKLYDYIINEVSPLIPPDDFED